MPLPTRRSFLRLAGAAAAAPHTLLAQSDEAKRPKPPPPPPPPPQAPFSTVEYQGALPALLQHLPAYTDADVAALLRERAEDPQGLPGEVSHGAAEFSLVQLLRMVPRVLFTSARGGQTRRFAHVLLSPYVGTSVLASAAITQYKRTTGTSDSFESRLACTLCQGSKVRLAYTQPPLAKVTMAREGDASTLVAYDPVSTDAALNAPDGGLTLRYRTSLGGGAGAQYVWANNLTGPYRAEATTSAGRGVRSEHVLTGTPWFSEGHYSVFQLLHQVVRVALWNRAVDPAAIRYYDVLAVLSASEGGYHEGGIGLRLFAFGVDWQNGKPVFIPGHVRADLTLTYPNEGPDAGKLGTLTLAIHPDSDFQGAGGVLAAPLFNPSAGEWVSLTDPRLETAIYNHPADPEGLQRVRTADMAALVKGVRNTAHPAWGVIPYRGL